MKSKVGGGPCDGVLYRIARGKNGEKRTSRIQ